MMGPMLGGSLADQLSTHLLLILIQPKNKDLKDLKLTKVVPQKRKANESGQLTLTMRHERKMKYTDIGSQLQLKVVLSQPCRDSTRICKRFLYVSGPGRC